MDSMASMDSMTARSFPHFHCHTHSILLDGMTKIPDPGNMYGLSLIHI